MTLEESVSWIAALGIVAWGIFAEFRIRDMQAKLLIMEQDKKDADIAVKTSALSDPELDAFLIKKLGAESDPTKK